MLYWFPIGKIIKMTVLAGVLAAGGLIVKSNLQKLGGLFPDGSAASIASVREVAQAVQGIKTLIDNSQVFSGQDLNSDDEESVDDDADGGAPSLEERTQALKELFSNSSIYPSDGAHTDLRGRRHRGD